MLDIVTVFAPIVDALDHRIDTLHQFGVLGDRQTPGGERAVGLVLRGGGVAFDPSEAVTDHPQPTPRGDRGILLAQRTRRGIARIRVRRFALGHDRGIEGLEILQPEVDLAAHLEQIRDRVLRRRGQLTGDVLDGACVERDVLTGASVAAGRAAHQPSLLVNQVQRDTVDLHLAQIVQIRPGFGLDPARPGTQFIEIEDIVQ